MIQFDIDENEDSLIKETKKKLMIERAKYLLEMINRDPLVIDTIKKL